VNGYSDDVFDPEAEDAKDYVGRNPFYEDYRYDHSLLPIAGTDVMTYVTYLWGCKPTGSDNEIQCKSCETSMDLRVPL